MAGPDTTPPDLVAEGASRLIAGAALPLAPPPRLGMPDGTIALDEHIATAETRYGVAIRSRHIVNTW